MTGGIGFCVAVLFGAAIGGREELKSTVPLEDDAKIRETALRAEEGVALDSPPDSALEATDAAEEASLAEEAAGAELVKKVLEATAESLEAAGALEAAELTAEEDAGADDAGGL